jgi:hypothetical protein
MRVRAGAAVVSLIASLLVLAAAPAAAAAIINVPASQLTIQAGIDAASNGDTVVVAPGTYAERIDFKGKAIEVRSSAGPATTIIDGGGLPNVVSFKTGENRSSVLRGFTVTNGAYGQDGFRGIGILINQASPTVVGNVVTRNTAPEGSGAGVGIASYQGSPLIEKNQIIDNSGGSIGGGIDADGGNPEIVGNLIQGHSAAFGGGVSVRGGTLRDNVIRGNTGSAGGGVLANGNLLMVNNLIVGNTALATGGGLVFGGPSTETGSLLNNTVAGNQSPVGAAVTLGSGGLKVINNVLAGPAGLSAVYCLNAAAGGTLFSHNDVYNAAFNGATPPFEGCPDPTGTNGNISVDPALAADYKLRRGSPAIDAGDNAVSPRPLADVLGNTRVADGDGNGSAVIDMGAIESPVPAPGAVVHVPASKATIQAGIDAASDGDTVVVAPGTYVERIDFKGKTIEVRSSAGPATTVIDGGGLPHVVSFKTGETRASILRGFTVTNGALGPGAFTGIGIHIYRASPTIVGNVVSGNTAPPGSGAGIGISTEDGAPLIESNWIADNPGGSIGGGIRAAEGAPQIIGNLIQGHSASFGAGVEMGPGTLRGNFIRGNNASATGGGVIGSSAARLENNLIVGNSAGTSGGGLAWHSHAAGTFPLINNTVTGNQAPAGAAILLQEAGLTLSNNDIVGPAGSSVVKCEGGAEGATAFSHNDVYNGTASPYAGCSNQTGTNGNISADPLLAADFRLLAGSPAIDAGAAGPSVPTTDLTGNPRPTDGDGNGVAVVDMGAFEAPAVPVPTYHPLAPTRILDTRSGNGAPVAKLGANGTLSLQVTGRGGVPATGVASVVLNVTVTEASAVSFLTAWPAGAVRPLTSNLNYTAGATVPNLVVVKVGTDGKVNLFNFAGSAHVIADVAGWYGGGDGERYSALTPARILDTRVGNGAPAGKLGAGAAMTLQVTGRGGVPATGVSAVVLNVTVTDTVSGGFLTAWPAGEALPVASNLNYVAGQTVANLVKVKVGAGGAVNLKSTGGPLNVIADVAGYFSDAGAGLATATPARILDTRTGLGAPQAKLGADGTLSLQVTGQGGVPATGVTAVVLNVTLTEPATGGWLAAWPAGEARPPVSNLNYVAGQTVPNLVIVKVGAGGKVNLYSSGGPVHVIADVAGWFTT